MTLQLERNGFKACAALSRVARVHAARQSLKITPARRFKVDVRFFQTSVSRLRNAPFTPEATHPQIQRGSSKLFKSADEAIFDLKDGVTLLSAGFGLCGVAETLIQAIGRKGTKGLTAVSNNAGSNDVGLEGLTSKGQISRMIMSYLGSNKKLEQEYLTGKVAIELTPQGTLAEKLRAGGAGIPAFYTSTGVRTHVQTGDIPIRFSPPDEMGKSVIYEPGKAKETRFFNGKSYIMETALTGDFAILRANKVDKAGNCKFNFTTKSYATIMAKAAKVAIVEADEIVEIGELGPEDIDLPGIYIDRIVPATAPKEIEFKKLAPESSSPTSPSASNSSSLSGIGSMSGKEKKRHIIAKRAASELKDGYYANLGVGIPTLAASYVSPSTQVWLQSENGILGMGPYPSNESEIDPDLTNAGKETVTLVAGASTFDSSESFAMIRGGHVDVSILGAMQVSSAGDLANYMIPGKIFKGMGGAMDLVSNPESTKIVVATEHVDKNGRPKIVEECGLPLTGKNVVSTIITDLCVFQVDRERGSLVLTELAESVSLEDVKAKTDARFKVADEVKTWSL